MPFALATIKWSKNLCIIEIRRLEHIRETKKRE